MHISIERAELVRIVTTAGRAVPRRTTIDILGCVLLTAEGGKLQARGSDLDLEISVSAAAEHDTDGAFAVDAAKLGDIARKLAGDTVTIDTADGFATVKAGRSRFKLPMRDAADFPSLSGGGQPVTSFTIDSAELARMLNATVLAVSTEATRYYLNGVYLHHIDGSLRAVATDGHRLARVDIPAPEGAEALPGIIVPTKMVHEMARLAGSVTVVANTTSIGVSAGDVAVTSKLIDGRFPDYGRVIPQDNDRVLLVSRDALRDAVARVATMAAGDSRAIRLDLADSEVTLSVNGQDGGSASEFVPADYAAEPMTIGFNSAYVAEVVGAIAGEEVEARFADPGTPPLFTAPGKTDVLYIIMPMSVQ